LTRTFSRRRRQRRVDPEADTAGSGLADAGVLRNTAIQFSARMTGAVFSGGLTLYLVRALGASRYGIYALAASIGTLVLLPAGLGLPAAVGRYVADHRDDLRHVRAIFVLGLKLQLPAALVSGLLLFFLAGPLTSALGHPRLFWPLRWMGVVVVVMAMFTFVGSVCTSLRQSSLSLWMALIESAVETMFAIALVIAGAGAAGAMAGKAIGYTIGAAAGLYLTTRLLRGLRDRGPLPDEVTARTVVVYAGATFLVDVMFAAFAQIDILMVGILLGSVDVGSFGAVVRVLTVLAYLGTSVAGGVAPRLSLRGTPDTRAFNQGIRFLIVAQGLAIGPMVVWSRPITELLLGSGYRHAAEILQLLSVQMFIGAPAALITVAVTYLGAARRRVPIMAVTLVLGLIMTYVLIRTVGVLGAAIADDVVQVVYVAANLWICADLITVDTRSLARSLLRTVAAGGVMALILFAFGTDHLSVLQWIVGGCAGVAGFSVVLVLTREISLDELKLGVERVRAYVARTRRA
jgi:O-antigen/teichoic acid export membrane protein